MFTVSFSDIVLVLVYIFCSVSSGEVEFLLFEFVQEVKLIKSREEIVTYSLFNLFI